VDFNACTSVLTALVDGNLQVLRIRYHYHLETLAVFCASSWPTDCYRKKNIVEWAKRLGVALVWQNKKLTKSDDFAQARSGDLLCPDSRKGVC